MTANAIIHPQEIIHQAARTDLREVAGTLQAVLGRRLTAYAAGVRDGKAVSRWASGEVTSIRDVSVEQRLREAYVIVALLEAAGEAPSTIRAWAMGMDPLLDDAAPIEAIRDDKLREARRAALAFAGGM